MVGWYTRFVLDQQNSACFRLRRIPKRCERNPRVAVQNRNQSSGKLGEAPTDWALSPLTLGQIGGASFSRFRDVPGCELDDALDPGMWKMAMRR